MRKAVFVLLLLCLSSPILARGRTQGWCEDGNYTVSVPGGTGASTARYQRSFSSCTVTVFDAGTVNLSSIFSDDAGTAKANPFTAAATGQWFFYADDGRYDVQFSGSDVPAPFTIGDVGVVDETGFGAIPEDCSKPAHGTGADIGARINTCVASLPAAGGIADIRGFTGTVVVSSDITCAKPVKFLFGHTTFQLGTDQILITGDGCRLQGQGSFQDEAGANIGATIFQYTGSAEAILVGDGTNPIFNTQLVRIKIEATGGAVTSATAVGIKMINSRYADMEYITVEDFALGTGINMNAAISFSATNFLRWPMMHNNKVGILADGTGAVPKDNHLVIVGGFVIGQTGGPIANSIGINLDKWSNGAYIYGTDVETFAVGYRIEGDGHHLMSSRGEFNTVGIDIIAGATGTNLISHSYVGGDTFVDAGSNTTRLDDNGYFGRLPILPSADASEILHVQKADGTSIFDVSTNAPARVELNNSANFTAYVGNFATPKLEYLGATGNTRLRGAINIQPDVDGTGVFTIKNAAGLPYQDNVTTPASPSHGILNSADLIIYSDSGVTVKAIIDGATGNMTTQGSLRFGGGGTLARYLTLAPSLDFTALAANSCEVLTATVTDAAEEDAVMLGIPDALADVDGGTERTVFFGWVSAADTVSVRRCNVTGTVTANPAADVIRIGVWQH